MRAFALLDLRDALPTLVLLAAVLIAYALIDDTLTFLLVMGVAIALAVAGYRYAKAGERGARQREQRARFNELLDPTERRARQVARTVPFCVALALGIIAGRGLLDGIVFAIAAAVGFVAAQVIFAAWLSARRSGAERFG